MNPRIPISKSYSAVEDAKKASSGYDVEESRSVGAVKKMSSTLLMALAMGDCRKIPILVCQASSTSQSASTIHASSISTTSSSNQATSTASSSNQAADLIHSQGFCPETMVAQPSSQGLSGSHGRSRSQSESAVRERFTRR